MQLNRQDITNFGTLHQCYFGLSSDYAQVLIDNGGSGENLSAAVLANHFHKVEFEFEKGTWQERLSRSSQGNAYNYEVVLQLKGFNAAVRTWRSYWAAQELMIYLVDQQGNSFIIGNDQEPLELLSGEKRHEQNVNQGSYYNLIASGDMRLAV